MRGLQGEFSEPKHQVGFYDSVNLVAKFEVQSFFNVERMPRPRRDLFEANLRALRHYAPQPYSGRVTLFLARGRPLFNPRRHDTLWRQLAAGGVEVRVLPGNHKTIMHEPYVQALAALLKAELNRADSTTGEAGNFGVGQRSVVKS